MMKEMGPVDPIVSHYLRGNSEIDNHKIWEDHEIEYANGGFDLLEIGIRKKGGSYEDVMRMDEELEIVMRYRLSEPKEHFWLTLRYKNEDGEPIFTSSGGGKLYAIHNRPGEFIQKSTIPANFLNWGNYAFDLVALERTNEIRALVDAHDIISFTVSNKQVAIGGWLGKEPGYVTPQFEFEEERVH